MHVFFLSTIRNIMTQYNDKKNTCIGRFFNKSENQLFLFGALKLILPVTKDPFNRCNRLIGASRMIEEKLYCI